jgi:aspartyl-tRNA(Asn)/glutamyl-tRNA(Gln) amidotransferase subunit A
VSNDHIPLTATEMLAGFASGDTSPVVQTQAALDRIEARDGELNAFCVVDADGAMAQAKESESRWQHGNPLGLLDGVPASVKDLFYTAGWPTLRGSHCVDPDVDWSSDSPVTARLRESGAVLLGKTTTPELAWKAVTDSPLTGITRNPWDPRLTPGGSSGGSAVAVATGMGALSVGTDGGGSVRIPASFCGIPAFKPTFGRIPLYPASPFGQLSHAGPMAWSIDDLALLLDVLALPDHRDPTALPVAPGAYREAVRRDVHGLRVAFSPDLGYVHVDAEIAGIVAAAVNELEDAGLLVWQQDPGFDDPIEDFDVLWVAGAARALDTLPAERTGRIDPGLRELWARGPGISASRYLQANERRTELGLTMGRFHEDYDVLLTPTMPIAPFEVGHDVPPGNYPGWPAWTQFSYPFNMTQQPAATVPVGRTEAGLPVGLQVIGPRHSDDLVLAVGKLVESLRPWHAVRP